MSLLFLIILQSFIFIYLSYKLIGYLRKKFKTHKSNSPKEEAPEKEKEKSLDEPKILDTWKILNPYDEQIFGQGKPSIIAPEEQGTTLNKEQIMVSNSGEGLVSDNEQRMVSNNGEAIILNSAKDVKDHLLTKKIKRIEEPEEVEEPEFIPRQLETKPLERQGGLIPANMENKKVKIENLVSSLIDILID